MTLEPPRAISNPYPNYYAVLLAGVAGGLLPIQLAMNAHLANATQSALLAASIANLVGSLVLAGVLSTGRFGGIDLTGLRKAPWWNYMGSLFGTGFVVLSAYVTSILGTTLTVGLVIGGQMLAGFCVDCFGWFGVKRRPFTRYQQLAAVLIGVAIALLMI